MLTRYYTTTTLAFHVNSYTSFDGPLSYSRSGEIQAESRDIQEHRCANIVSGFFPIRYGAIIQELEIFFGSEQKVAEAVIPLFRPNVLQSL
jgi:hypothetical protein